MKLSKLLGTQMKKRDYYTEQEVALASLLTIYFVHEHPLNSYRVFPGYNTGYLRQIDALYYGTVQGKDCESIPSSIETFARIIAPYLIQQDIEYVYRFAQQNNMVSSVQLSDVGSMHEFEATFYTYPWFVHSNTRKEIVQYIHGKHPLYKSEYIPGKFDIAKSIAFTDNVPPGHVASFDFSRIIIFDGNVMWEYKQKPQPHTVVERLLEIKFAPKVTF